MEKMTKEEKRISAMLMADRIMIHPRIQRIDPNKLTEEEVERVGAIHNKEVADITVADIKYIDEIEKKYGIGGK